MLSVGIIILILYLHFSCPVTFLQAKEVDILGLGHHQPLLQAAQATQVCCLSVHMNCMFDLSLSFSPPLSLSPSLSLSLSLSLPLFQALSLSLPPRKSKLVHNCTKAQAFSIQLFFFLYTGNLTMKSNKY